MQQRRFLQFQRPDRYSACGCEGRDGVTMEIRPMDGRTSVVLAFLMLALTLPVAQAIPVYYAADFESIAIDPYRDGFGGEIHVDFDADHSAYRTIAQIYTVYRRGEPMQLTSLAHARATGATTATRFANHLESPGSANDFVLEYANTMSGIAQRTRFWSPKWAPTRGDSILYMQPLDENMNPIPISYADLQSIYFKQGRNGAWISIGGIVAPVSEPGMLELMLLGLAGLRFAAERRSTSG